MNQPLADNPEFQALANRVNRMQIELQANTIATRQVEENTASIVDAFHAAQGAFKVLEFIGKCAKIVFPLVVVFGAIKVGVLELIAAIIIKARGL